jgi:ABC-type dipeptide/oligopeptide/nickel transport system permease component
LTVFLARRLVAALLFVIAVSSSALVLARLAPGDATTGLRLSGADQTTIDETRVRLGLDQPVVVALGQWLNGLRRFDLGYSSRFRRPVSDLIGDRAPRTAMLAGLALLLATAIGLPLGVLTGARPRGWVSALVTPVSIALLACPPLVGALGLLFLAVSTGWLSTAQGAWAVPTLALALPLAASLERLQSQATSEAMKAPGLSAASARGVPAARLLWVHVARQSLRPVLGVYGLVIGGLFSGSLAVEVITSWPGLGSLTYEALVGRDLHLLAGCVLMGAVFIAFGNLLADVMRALVDPRVRDAA